MSFWEQKVINNWIEQYNILAWTIMVSIMEYQIAIKNKQEGPGSCSSAG